MLQSDLYSTTNSVSKKGTRRNTTSNTPLWSWCRINLQRGWQSYWVPSLQQSPWLRQHTSKGYQELQRCSNWATSRVVGKQVKFHRTFRMQIITLCKKRGERSNCNNYQGISLLSIVGKGFVRVFFFLEGKRLNEYLSRLQILASSVYPCNLQNCPSSMY